MAYTMPYCHTMQGQLFFNGNMQTQPLYHQEDLEFDNLWMENIDPLLRQTQTQESNLPWQPQALRRFIDEPVRNLFTAGPLPNRPQSFLRGMNRPSHGISSLPHAAPGRMVSPSPSQELSSQCSSARSPVEENEWYHENNYYSPQRDDYSPPKATSHFTQGLPELWNDRTQRNNFPQVPVGYNCVNLSQVQGIPDPQEVAFENDEGYMDMDTKTEYAIEVEPRNMKIEAVHNHNHTSYRHSSDEGLGASIKDEGSPQNTGVTHTEIDRTTDVEVDAEGEDDTIVAEAASDTEYSPKSTRTRKRRLSKVSSPPAIKRGRVAKTGPKSRLPFTCKSCNHAPFKDAATLQRHVNSNHTRAFICVFGFAGCNSTFASKNEWKRHVSSQHLNLNSWVCEQGSCGKVQNQSKKDGGGVVKGSEFNRKDLFTQHLRRMHAPFAVKRQNKKTPEWEERLKELQTTCLRVKRQPPARLACPLSDCDGFFEGASCWDDRMEHVGKHLEKAAASTGANKFDIHQEDDQHLVTWALREHIVEQRTNGGYKLSGPWVEKVEDEDADGEYE